jgi:endonuclease/exonuclease/phosphatase family metal-dependent hydrolase
MTRTFSIAAAGLLLVGAVLALLWAGVGRRPPDALERQTSYDASSAPTDRDTFTAVTYNVGALAPASDGSEGRRSFDRASALLREVRPDFVALQEMTSGAGRPGGSSRLDSLAQHLRAVASAEAPRRPARLSSLLSRIGGASPSSGQALLSRFPIRRHSRQPIDRDSSSLWGRLVRPQSVVQVAVAGIGGWPLVLMNINIDAAEASARIRQARAVNRFYRRVSRQGFAVLLLGSIRPARSAESTVLSDDTRRALLRGTSLQPAIFPESALISGRSVGTYPAGDPSRKVDYIFYRPRRVVPTDATVRCGDDPPPSNHCAVSLSFLLPRPLDKLPDTRIPDEKLPSLERLLTPEPGA